MAQEPNKLILLLKQSRDKREGFFLKGSRICYRAPSDNKDVQLIKSRLHEIVRNETYINELEGKVERRPRMMVEIELLHSIFCTYDMTATYSEDVPLKLAQEVKALLYRIHSSRDGHLYQSSNLDPFELKVSKLELCHLEKESNRDDALVCHFEEDLLHEIFVMFLYTNRMRRIIPNFQLCYAGFKSARPSALTPNQEECIGICPCDTSQTVDYLLLERIPGVKMTRALEICTLQEFLSMILQIAFALELGVVHFGFTHYNLHPDNVVIRSIPKTKIRYFHNNKILLLETGNVAVLTNFETAHVKHKYDGVVQNELVVNQSEHFGPIGYDTLGIFHNETRPFYDLYKILMFSFRILKAKNKKVFQEARRLAKFFGFTYVVDLDKALKSEYKLGYIYSKTVSDKERVRSIKDFIAHLLFEFPEVSSFLTPIEDYDQVDYLDCQGYCLLGDYPLETTKVQVGPVHNQKNYIREVTFRELLSLFAPRDFIDRHHGLKKRSEELQKKAGILCDLNDKLCKNYIEEALEAKKEFDDFRQLVEFGKFEIRRRALEEIQQERQMIDEMIRVNNLDIESHLRQVRELTVKSRIDGFEVQTAIVPSRESICYHREQIKGRLVVLVNLVSSLNEFGLKFNIQQPMPEITVEGLIPFEEDL